MRNVPSFSHDAVHTSSTLRAIDQCNESEHAFAVTVAKADQIDALTAAAALAGQKDGKCKKTDPEKVESGHANFAGNQQGPHAEHLAGSPCKHSQRFR